jgi:hypothetical protein
VLRRGVAAHQRASQDTDQNPLLLHSHNLLNIRRA